MPLENPNSEQLFEVGPFGGLDATTDPLFVNGSNALDCLNFVPYRRYGAFTLTKGRRSLSGGVTWNGVPQSMYSVSNSNFEPYLIAAVLSPTLIQSFQSLSNTNTTFALPAGYSFNNTSQYMDTWAFCEASGLILASHIDATGLKFSGGSCTNWQINPSNNPPTFGGPVAGSLNGVYFWRYTYYNSNTGQESSPSVIGSQTLSNQQVAVNWTASPDAQVTHVRLYRLGGTLPQWMQVAQVAVGTTLYQDNTPDNSLQGATLVLHRDPPANFQGICLHKDRLWGFGYPTSPYPWVYTPNPSSNPTYQTGPVQPSDLWFSRYAEPWAFDAVNNVIPLGRASSGDFPDRAVGLASTGSVLVALKNFTTYIVVGDTEQDFRGIKALDEGCINRETIASAYGFVFWLGQTGVKMFSGQAPQTVSDGDASIGGIKTILDLHVLSRITSNGGLSLDLGHKQWRAVVHNHCYYLSNGNIVLGYHIPTQRWFKLPWASPLICGNAEQNVVWALQTGSLTPSVDRWFFADGDSYGPLVGTWVSPWFDCGARNARKLFRMLEVEIPPSDPANTVKVTFMVDGVNVYTSPTLTPRVPGVGGYYGTILNDVPTLYLRCDEVVYNGQVVNYGSGGAIGAIIADQGTALGAPGLLVGDPNPGMIANGNTIVNSIIYSPSALAPAACVPSTTLLGVECWIRPDMTWRSSQANPTLIAEYGVDSGPTWSLRRTGGALTAQWIVNTNGGQKILNGATNLYPGTRYHIVGTYDGANLRLYVNGVQDAVLAFIGTIVDTAVSTQALQIGRAQAGAPATVGYGGAIDEFAVYTGLSAAQILSHYNAGNAAGGSYQSGNAYYRLSLPPVCSGYRAQIILQATEAGTIPPVVERVTAYGIFKDVLSPVATNPNGST